MIDSLHATELGSTVVPHATITGESTNLSSFGSLGRRLSVALDQLEEQSKPLQLESLAGRDWYDLLIRKLLPQLEDNPHLIVAVVGGTNIGKSVVFNHIAGFRASSSSPLASGTKHPVCLIPDGFAARHDLQSLFPAFELRPWTDSDEALASYSEHCLFWRTSRDVPPNLVILDTPDVDSDAPINWHRADAVRQAADVLVAVLTQQKYNDAAVKQFFRKAAEEDKAALIVFNQVELPDDEPYWPLWLNTFCGETGLQPEFVYLAPNDRKAAEAIRLRFEERSWPVKQSISDSKDQQAGQTHEASSASNSVSGPSDATAREPVQLRIVLSQLRFDEIKLRTLRGSLRRLVENENGAPHYLREIQQRSQQFRDAAEVFASRSLIRHSDWPAPPNSLIVEEMWHWWDGHREVWTSSVHGFYAHVGRWMSGGVRVVRQRIWGQPILPLDEYRQAEWDAIVRVLQQVYDQLRVITTLGNELLTSRLDRLLSGTTCESVIEQLRKDHDEFDFEKLIESLVETEMTAMRSDREQLFKVIRNADRAAAVARPVLTLLLAFGGAFGAEHMLVHAASQSLTHVAVDATVAAGTTVAGNAAVDTATGVLSQVKAWLLQLHLKFKARREEWLTTKLREHLLGDLVDELHAGAIIPESEAFREVDRLIKQFEGCLVV
jgi:50S ribosome-binding GTPase